MAFVLAACGTGGIASGTADQENGKKLFQQECGGCHALSAAGTSGTIGPNLNDLKAAAAKLGKGKTPEEYIRESILDPGAVIVPGFSNAMPSFKGRLTDKQIQTLIDYLLKSGGG